MSVVKLIENGVECDKRNLTGRFEFRHIIPFAQGDLN